MRSMSRGLPAAHRAHPPGLRASSRGPGRNVPRLHASPRGAGAEGHGRDNRRPGRCMSVQTKVAAADSMIPETAPFSPEQRAWLNGFFSGLLSLDAKAGATALDGAMPDLATKALVA